MTVKYTPEHEWVQIEDLPETGRTYDKGEVAGVVESVKAAADVYMPIAGEVTAVNEDLRADPSLANKEPMGGGWFFKMKIKDMAQFDALMDEPAYQQFVKTNA
jgi:glycine cleavage system H protein